LTAPAVEQSRAARKSCARAGARRVRGGDRIGLLPKEPAQFCRVVASLLPRDVRIEGHVDLLADVTGSIEAFHKLTEMIGAEPKLGARQMRKLIDHDPAR
jgi:hypothetical protein